jgi:hypothetical protein
MRVKLALAGEGGGGGVHAHPLSLHLPTITSKVAVYAPAEWADHGVHIFSRDETTEYTELQPLLSGAHSVMRVRSVLAGEGEGCTPTPSHYIYPYQ